MVCEACKYKTQDPTEELNWYRYGCCRAHLEKLPVSGNVVTQCSLDRSTGIYHPPQVTDEGDQGFKENFIKKYEQKGCKDKPS